MKTLLRRAAATGVPIGNLAKYLLTFSTTHRLEKVHPLQGGIFRLKHPSERRPGRSRENPRFFWLRFTWETLLKHAILAGAIGRLLIWQTVIAYGLGRITIWTRRSHRSATTGMRRSTFLQRRLAHALRLLTSRRSPD
jgi:hypothetical protein